MVYKIPPWGGGGKPYLASGLKWLGWEILSMLLLKITYVLLMNFLSDASLDTEAVNGY